jgi:hypothetical protein
MKPSAQNYMTLVGSLETTDMGLNYIAQWKRDYLACIGALGSIFSTAKDKNERTKNSTETINIS